ncbi:hypothetical protein [Mucilaginibacter ginsenosidivorans]|uniref:Uncharacterized protein n=1 Tax=Mucilaginibacter ginsenosidivorans TaxID=398053 RepID=A0A5B8V1B4_9SPHI|nr:hypothetical protein [Mucilaginibacter ginsenosidivorans]QEC64949.1 hypothetical protein FRZ54_21045 [Mucilaginibacter ginsenosidivorans]
MKKFLLSACLLLFCVSISFADTVTIKHFAIKENPFAQNEIAVVAVDTASNILENINGIFSFTVNGFQKDLRFDKGTAFYHEKLDKSSFLYVKHVDEAGTHSILYYVYKGDHKLIPVHISWIVLLAIPILLVVLGYMFKKFIIIAAIIFIVFIYFNYNHNLGAGTFFESIIDGLKGMFGK